jgi:hypothetical protein
MIVISMATGTLFGQGKPGGIAREIAMGGSNTGINIALNPFIIEDPAFVLVNPAYQSMYKDYAWANIAGGTITGLSSQPTSSPGYGIGDDGYGHQNAGLAFGVSDNLTLGAILSYDPSAINGINERTVIGTISQRPPQAIPKVGNIWEVVGSYALSPSHSIGLGILYGWSNADETNSSLDPRHAEASSSVFGLRGGFNCTLGTASSLDASAAVRFDRTTDNITNGSGSGGNYSTSGTEYQIEARAKLNVSPKFNVVPYGAYLSISAEPKEDAAPAGLLRTPNSLKLSATAYALGIGGEYHTQSLYLAGGLSWQSLRLKNEISVPADTGTNSFTTTALPVVNVGLEWWFTDWLAGRTGYYRSIANANSKVEPASSGSNGSEANLSIPNSIVTIGALNGSNFDGLITIGLGFKFGGATIDATVSDAALRRGLGLIGSQDAVNTFGYMTASYSFGE